MVTLTEPLSGSKSVKGVVRSMLLHTQAGPAQLSIARDRLLGIDLEPHIPAAIPGRNILPGGSLCHVELQRSRVENIRVRLESDAGACSDRLRLR